ncbi:Gfo/Idh/MocA family oxidoreductase [Candidatus Uhrbacteria bacterium]|nr:Gfo/Idh/MocA family oxidoreductase [Candidatus Uhrbacteria bacterium]
MSSQINLALIGRGHWGKVYERTITGLTQVTAGGYSVSLLQHIFGKDYKEAFTHPQMRNVDGIIVASSTSAHYEIAAHLFSRGFRNLLIEKPLTRTYEEAQKLQELAQKHPEAILMVDHTLLYDPAVRLMKEQATHTIGTIKHVNYTSLKTPLIEGNTIIPDAGSPPIYLFLDIAGASPLSIAAKPKENDNVEITVEFKNGMRAVAKIGSVYSERKREIVFSGEHGTLMLTEFMNPREIIFADLNGNQTPLAFPTDRTALEGALLEFAECIADKKQPATPFSAGAEVVKMIELAEQSFKKGGEPVLCI